MTATHDASDTEPGALSVDDFCSRFGVKRTSTYSELKAGRLSAVKCGRRTLIPLAEAQRWFQSLPSYAHA